MKGIEAIQTDEAPRAIGPYSQAVRVVGGDWVFCSGQIGIDPATGELVAGGVEAESRQALRNLLNVLDAAGFAATDVVRTTVYLVDLSMFSIVNAIYAEHFSAPWPARATIGVAALPKGARVELDAIAVRPG